uniref:Alstrom syndrome protein 1 n=1 Tax=Cacopsylla melanoneura TaxID=428564 RepID=A0A8D9A8J7_9HEMI
MRYPAQGNIEPTSKQRRGKYYPLFPHFSEDGNSTGHRRTNSLELLLADKGNGLKSSSLPHRSLSVASLTLDDTQGQMECYAGDLAQGLHHPTSDEGLVEAFNPSLLPPPPYSASSSSLSTIITRDNRQASASKLIQTVLPARSSVTTQTLATLQSQGGRCSGGLCTGAHPRHSIVPPTPLDNISDLEDNLIRESNPGERETNCNTLDSIGSEQTVGSWVGKTYYNNQYERQPDGGNNGEGEDGVNHISYSQDISPADEDYHHIDDQDQSRQEEDNNQDELEEEHPEDSQLMDSRQCGDRSDQIDRVNSFEYLPGPLYEQNQATHDSSSDSIEEQEEGSRQNGDLEDNRRDVVSDPLQDDSHGVSDLQDDLDHDLSSPSSTLRRDVDTGVHLIRNLLQDTARDSRQFIRHFVHTLIKTSTPTQDGPRGHQQVQNAVHVPQNGAHEPQNGAQKQTDPKYINGKPMRSIDDKHFGKQTSREEKNERYENRNGIIDNSDRNRNGEGSNRNGIIDNGDRNRNRMMDHRLLHQNVPFTPILSESRREDLSGESATRSSELLMLSEDQDQTPVSGEGGSKEDHTTSSEMFKPKAKVYHLQPSLLQAPPNAHSTTLTSEDDSLRHNAKLRPQYPLHQSEASARPKYPTVNQSERLIEEPIEPLGSRSEEEVMCKQERAMRRLYEKQTRVHPNPANETLVNYLQLERQNQLDWIKAEIDHLSNLKNLLEKQETLKRHITAYKQTRRVRQTLVRPTGGVSSSGESNQRPAAQETTDQPQKRAKTTGHRKGDGDTAEESNPFEQDKASIYAHKINKDSEYNHPHRSNKEREQQTALYVHNVNRERNRTSVQANKKEKDGDRGLDKEGASQPSGQAHKLNKDREWMLPCEFRRRQRNVPTSLKLKHNMNEMMTRDVEKVGLKPTTATTVGATQSTRLKSSTATVESATVKSTLATRSTTPVESTAIQTSDSLLNLPAWLSKPASVEPLTPQENVGSRLASSNQGINKESPPQLCPCIVELYTRVKSGQELLGAGSGSGCKCYSKQNKPGRENIAPPPVGYVITFEPRSKKPKPSTPVDSVPKSPTNPGFSSSESEITTKPRIKTLQEYLEHNRPDYVNRAETRRQCLVEKSYLREQQNSVQHKQKVLLTALKYGAGSESEDKTSGKSKGSHHHGRKIFTTRELRSMTRRKYEQLPEVQMKKMDAKRKEAYRTNKLMAEVFTKKLQRKALKGVVDLSNSDQILSTIS